MKRVLTSLLAVSLLVCAGPSFAGLGDAEGGTQREFDAYCGEKGNKCKVRFEGDFLIVNEKDRISKDMIKKYSTESCFRCLDGRRSGCIIHACQEGTALVIYEENGKEGSGVFIFQNRGAWKQFERALSAFCGASCRPLGPSIKLEQ